MGFEDKILDPEMQDLISKIRMASPTQKINFNKEDMFHVAGMYLCINNDIESEMNCDLSDLYDTTYLFMDKRTLIECTQIIDGTLQLLLNNNIISSDDHDSIIKSILSNTSLGITYAELKKNNKNILDTISDKIKNDKIQSNISYILDNIWFLPYTEIDLLCEKALNDFKKMGDADERND